MAGRQSSELWVSRDTRSLVNEPKELLLSGQRGPGIPGRNSATAFSAMKALAEQDGDLADWRKFDADALQ